MRNRFSIVTILLLFMACVRVPAQNGPGLWTVDISSDDKYIALGGDDSLLRIFRSDLTVYRSIKLKTEGMIRFVNWHPSENLLAIASRNKVWILDPETGKEVKLLGINEGSRTIGWNYNGELLAIAGGHGKLWIWNKKGELIRQIQKKDEQGHPDRKDFLGLDWHPSKNILVTVGDEIRIFDTTGKELNMFRHREQRAGILSVKWHPSGEFFVTGDYGHPKEGILNLLQFWKPDGTLIRENRESINEFRNIRWNKDGSLLATASDALRIWTKEGKLLHSGSSQGNTLWGVDWNSGSTKLVTVSYHPGDIQSWSNTGKLLATYK